jgi:DNA-directed RNA polymerase specialized sigma24 family protein
MDDADAFSFLDEGEGEAVFFFLARRTMDAEVAVDLTAETFAVALRSWRTLRSLGPEQRRAWLFTVARRLHARYVRRARVIQVPSLHRDDLALIEERCGLGELRAATHACRRGSTATQRSAAPPC